MIASFYCILMSYWYTPHVIKELAVYTINGENFSGLYLCGIQFAVQGQGAYKFTFSKRFMGKLLRSSKNHENCNSLAQRNTTSMIGSSQVNIITVLLLIS